MSATERPSPKKSTHQFLRLGFIYIRDDEAAMRADEHFRYVR